MTWSHEKLIELFLKYFKEKRHKIIPSASLIPENDSSVLFTTAGMHPLVPFLLGQPHPMGKRLADVQKCLRTNDIEEVGDDCHLTFFLMLGNWSLGDYFKKEAIEMSLEFLTGRKWLNLDEKKLYITIFEGDKDAPRDEESLKEWKRKGIPEERIFLNPKKDNWWGPVGESGPCGPDTEIFYDTGKKKCSPDCRPGCNCGKYFEIWNDVFMEYFKTKEGKYEKLKQKNVDTGMGVERTIAVLQGKENVFETELYSSAMKKLQGLGNARNEKSGRIIADHLRAAVFVLGEKKVAPSNMDRGYVLRRLIRRAIRHARLIGVKANFCRQIGEEFIKSEGKEWPELKENKEFVLSELEKEEEKFSQTLMKGLKIFSQITEKNKVLNGKDAFLLFQSYGFPLEITMELAKEKGIKVNEKEFQEELKLHQEISRKATEKKFKSGLADQSKETIALHTATHLLHAALRKVLGEEVKQKGSNITPERLRFDFSYSKNIAPEQLNEVEKIVNEQIRKGLEVKREEKTLDEARKEKALAFFEEKYGEKVSVYSIGEFSKEVCAGPHIKNTRELGKFRITKLESIGTGTKRIKAVLEK
ncbi:MAG: alanine--tRNA ligase [Candidatus Diapherotrites archaeon]